MADSDADDIECAGSEGDSVDDKLRDDEDVCESLVLVVECEGDELTEPDADFEGLVSDEDGSEEALLEQDGD